jgi:phosphohistidine phosphatase
MGLFLRDRGWLPDFIISSTARRAVDTVSAMTAAVQYEVPVLRSRSLYHGRPASYLAALRSASPEASRVMLVGHNPGIEDLVQMLCGHYERMPTTALARFSIQAPAWELEGQWPRVTLLRIWRVKELPSP